MMTLQQECIANGTDLTRSCILGWTEENHRRYTDRATAENRSVAEWCLLGCYAVKTSNLIQICSNLSNNSLCDTTFRNRLVEIIIFKTNNMGLVDCLSLPSNAVFCSN
jgi:hypothetical protein